MIDLISHYALTDIVTFVVLLSLAIKGAVEFWDWAWKRIKGTVKKSEEVQDFKKEFLEKLSETEEGIREMFNKEAETRNQERDLRDKQIREIHKTQEEDREKINHLYQSVGILIDSDKDDIKAWITEKHHYFVNVLGEIDNYSLDCIEKRFQHYKDENGNSFIEDLVEDLRALPKIDASKALNERKKKREEAAKNAEKKT